MATVFQCDRCKRFCESAKLQYRSPVNDIKIKKGGCIETSIDLCPDCYDSLDEWFCPNDNTKNTEDTDDHP